MATRKNTKKAPVKVQDLTPKNDPKGGTSLTQASHDTKKAVIANFRV